MHECPECGTYCHCDGEDHHNDAASEECLHYETPECLEAQCDDSNYDPDD